MIDERPPSMKEAVGATTGLRLLVTEPTWDEPSLIELSQPFGVVGAAKESDVLLASSAVSYRHAYLQVLDGGVFCVDLGSKTGLFWGNERRPCGWVPCGDSIRVASYTLQVLDGSGLHPSGDGPGEWPNPLEAGLGSTLPFPDYALEFFDDSLPEVVRTIDRRIMLVGRHSICPVRFDDDSVSRVHCALVLLADGLWIVDLLGKYGTHLDGKRVRCGLLTSGCEIRIGVHSMSVWHRVPSRRGAATESDDPGSLPSIPSAPIEAPGRALQKPPSPGQTQGTEITPTETAPAAGPPRPENRDFGREAARSPDAAQVPVSTVTEPAFNNLEWRGQVFSVEEEGETLIIVPSLSGGKFRYEQIQTEINSLRRKLADRAVRHLVIDLKLLGYLGFEAFHVAVTLARSVEQSGGRAAMCCPSPELTEAFKNRGLDRLWPLYATRAEALRAVAEDEGG